MASGDSLGIYFANAAVLPTASAGQRSTRSTANNNEVSVINLDDSADESLMIEGHMPDNYGGGGVTATIQSMALSATSGDYIYDMQWMSITDDADDIDTKAFAAANSVTATAPSASGEFGYEDITFTDGADMDSVAAGENFLIRITRDADNGSDNMSGDLQFVSISLVET